MTLEISSKGKKIEDDKVGLSQQTFINQLMAEKQPLSVQAPQPQPQQPQKWSS